MLTYSLLLAFFGLALVYFEFFLPGGILAIIASIMILLGFFLLGAFGAGWAVALIYLFSCALATILVCLFALKRIRASAKKDSFYLSSDQEGFVAASLDQGLKGKIGTTSSELKPSGYVLIDSQIYQAISERGFLEKDEKIRVVEVRSSYVIVIPIKE